jgi:hypothetical protein
MTFWLVRVCIGLWCGLSSELKILYQGLERATAMPRVSSGHLPETAQ